MAEGHGPTRRTFLTATALPLLAPALARALALAYTPAQAPTSGRTFVTFDELDFPILDAGPLVPVPGARAAASVAELIEVLKPGVVLVWRHGSAFPLDAWTPIVKFLEDGGSLLYAGGEPFTRPVAGARAARRVELRTVAFLKALRLNQAYRVEAGGCEIRRTGSAAGRALPSTAWVAGGRWTFWLASDPPTSDERAWLLDEASRPPIEFRVDPTYGCFHDGEQPSIVLRAHRPRATDALTAPCAISLDGPGSSGRTVTIDLDVTARGSVSLALPGAFAPGLHRVTVDGGPLGRAVSGFWVFDAALFASGDAFTFDGYTLRRNGAPEPVVGTTTMSASAGWFEHDDAELPAERFGGGRRALRMIEEMQGLDTRADVWWFPGTLPESWYAADARLPRRVPRARGAIIHHPLPIEWAEPSPALARFYRAALPGDLTPRLVIDGGPRPGLLVTVVPFTRDWLVVAVNESSRAQQVVARRPGSNARVTLEVPAARARMVFVDPRAWTVIDRSG